MVYPQVIKHIYIYMYSFLEHIPFIDEFTSPYYKPTFTLGIFQPATCDYRRYATIWGNAFPLNCYYVNVGPRHLVPGSWSKNIQNHWGFSENQVPQLRNFHRPVPTAKKLDMMGLVILVLNPLIHLCDLCGQN